MFIYIGKIFDYTIKERLDNYTDLLFENFIKNKWQELQNFEFKNACLEYSCQFCKALNLV